MKTTRELWAEMAGNNAAIEICIRDVCRNPARKAETQKRIAKYTKRNAAIRREIDKRIITGEY